MLKDTDFQCSTSKHEILIMLGHTNIISCSSEPVCSYLNKTIQILFLISRIQKILHHFLFYYCSTFCILDSFNL